MYKLPDNIKQFYLDNPDELQARKFVSMQTLEDYLKDNNAMAIAPKCFERWQKIWDTAESYWLFPEEKDMKQMVDEEYANV